MNRTYEKIKGKAGIPPEERRRNNFKFFNAPVAAFICIDRDLTEWSMLNAGIYAGNMMLAAATHGPSADFDRHYDRVRR
ncbi:hypothetical protein BpJC4_18900 [Weizmannia acidilactici]|nr:nitroreductase family protein [Weizmannia acidilactici]GER67419.1 hypothetical protein BpJC4_18900 [Weizmannia acidilactici]